MFTGIVQESGRLTDDPQPSGQGGVRLAIGHSADLGRRLSIGASLAVSGVCLTVTELDGDPPLGCVVELSPETLSRTTLGALRRGDHVNLETALRVGDALGGHWVQGHVDGVTRVVDRRDLTDHRVLAFAIPPGQEPFLVEKGSVALDGVSLTVSALGTAPDRFLRGGAHPPHARGHDPVAPPAGRPGEPGGRHPGQIHAPDARRPRAGPPGGAFG